jgi:predicted dehydrogenase
LHAGQILRALESGKHVFCEKPLCLGEEELQQIQSVYSKSASKLMVGFNRRFAPMAQRMKSFLQEAGAPVAMHYRVNAGPLPHDHWINDPEQGGGRILGEMCHFVDFLSFLSGASPVSVRARSLPACGAEQDVVASIEFDNGSIGTISYLVNGDRAFSKERIEVLGGGSVAVLDDFRRLEFVRHGKKATSRSWLRQDKGLAAEWRAFSECIRTGAASPIPFEEIAASTLATIRIADSLRSGEAKQVSLDPQDLISAPLVS